MKRQSNNHNLCILCEKSPYKNPGVSLHRFPTSERLRTIWLKACNLTEDDYRTSRRLCSDHFAKECFSTLYTRKNLKTGSVPTIFPAGYFEHATHVENPKDENVMPVVELESSDEEEILFCPPTLVRYDNALNSYSTQWICKNCLSVLLSENAVRKHLKMPCKHKVIEDLRPVTVHDDDDNEGNTVNDDDDDVDDDDNDEDVNDNDSDEDYREDDEDNEEEEDEDTEDEDEIDDPYELLDVVHTI